MAKETTRSAAVHAADKLAETLSKLAMLGDLLSATDGTLAIDTPLVAGNTIYQLVADAQAAHDILENRRGDLEKLNSEKMLGSNVLSIEPKGGAL